MVTVLAVVQHEDGQMTSGPTGVACRWRTELKQQGTDNNGRIWFTLWTLTPCLVTWQGAPTPYVFKLEACTGQTVMVRLSNEQDP